ncbi:trigger factor [Aquimonas voraii]|uniref:Trigger factor n=1 Tax=Aquimonas voraii TaxID=265719 RepID=A0A1G6RXY0_9GAMM|nr:trigger factor [Aquimonas voraii]SDD08796.1 trigger factor [Aquimonas voraii]
MQVSVENVGKLERKLTVRLPAEGLQSQVATRLRELGRTVRLAGFRPGKVPAKVIEQRFGAQVRAEALGEVIRRGFSEAVEQEKLRPAVAPNIEATSTGEDGEVAFIATFEVMPEIGTIDVSGLKIEKPVSSVEEADVDRMIETLRMQRRTWNPVERAAAAGDMVMFESSATTDAGRVPAEGVERAGTIIGSGAILPALEEKLIGLAAGQEGEFEVEFPAEYRAAALAGKTAKMSVKLVRVSEPKLPEIDADFIRSFGVAEADVDSFRREVRANLERELKGALMARLKTQVVEKMLAAHADLELPSRMIESEAQALARQAEQQAAQQGNLGAKADPAQFMDTAKRRVAAAVLLGELARQNEIRLDARRLTETLNLIASTYEDPSEVVELYRREPQLMQGLQSRVIEDQVIDWIADHADLTEQKLDFQDVMRPMAA